jgi:cardiolipin synthase
MKNTWDEIKLYHSGDAFFAEFVARIRHAKKSITLESYIFEVDPLSDIILVELQLAVWRGCEVQLLVDGVGSFFWVDLLTKRCLKEGIRFRVYHPVPSIFQWIRTPGIFARTNRRNHRKVLIIDNEVALLGSFNVTRVHSEKIMGTRAWRDSGTLLKGEAIESLSAAFELAWNFSKNIPRFALDSGWAKDRMQVILRWQGLLRVNASDRIRRFLYRDLLRRIHSAKFRVYITTAYFLPKRALLKALTKAAERGVDVRVIMPGPTDLPFVKWAAQQIPYKLYQGGVRIFEYQSRILHAKYMIIDDWSSIGSFNLNHRSLLHDLEVEAVITDPEALASMAQQFHEDEIHSLLIDVTHYELSPWWWRFLTKLLFKLRYWF